MKQRIVIDTNVYISRLLLAQSVSGRAVARAWREDVTLVSTSILDELGVVLRRRKFAVTSAQKRLSRISRTFGKSVCTFPIRAAFGACRDPRDDKFLEVAVHGHADVIVTGDADLLALHPFRGIEILTPADYLARKSIGVCTGGPRCLQFRIYTANISGYAQGSPCAVNSTTAFGPGRTGNVLDECPARSTDSRTAGWQKRWETREEWPRLARIL